VRWAIPVPGGVANGQSIAFSVNHIQKLLGKFWRAVFKEVIINRRKIPQGSIECID
jgi:hypothetical protein